MAVAAFAPLDVDGEPQRRTHGLPPTCERPCVDLAHLRRFTLGDRLLEDEVLGLFEQQAGEVIATLGRATQSRDWTMATHTVKGSARAVGAFEVASIAERLETEGPDGTRTRQLIEEIEAALGRARRFIAANRLTNAGEMLAHR